MFFTIIIFLYIYGFWIKSMVVNGQLCNPQNLNFTIRETISFLHFMLVTVYCLFVSYIIIGQNVHYLTKFNKKP